MFSMTVIFGESPNGWVLLFKSKEAFDVAKSMFNTPTLTDFHGKMFELTDDFGQHAIISRDKIHGVMFEDLEQSKLAQIERGLHQTRTQIAAERAGQADPAISGFFRSKQQGPAVISPFNGAFRQ